jgi:hypothetical protein
MTMKRPQHTQTMQHIAFIAALMLATPVAAAEYVEVPPTPAPGSGVVFKHHPAGFRTDVVEIRLPGNDGDLEYKIAMKAGDTVVYSWELVNPANPDQFYTEFHGHTEARPGQPGTVTFYRKATGAKEQGTLIAPFDGIHGWYMQNQSTAPVAVRLHMAGFYELIPGQKTGAN